MVAEGLIDIRTSYIGSKSEGQYAYLCCDDGTVFRLCRANEYPGNDMFFFPYDKHRVIIEGEFNGDWLAVEKIEISDTAIDEITDEESVMPGESEPQTPDNDI